MLQRIILILALIFIGIPVFIAVSTSIFSRSNLDDIDIRPEKFRRQFPK